MVTSNRLQIMDDNERETFFQKKELGSNTYRERIRDERLFQLIKDPTKWPTESRKLLYGRFGISLPRQGNSRNSGRRNAGRINSAVNYEKPSKRNKGNYLDNGELNKPITEKDLKSGLFSLLNRDIIPKGVDLTDIINHQPTLIQTKPAEKHTYFERHERRPIQMFEFGREITSLKLDISSTPYVNSAKDKMIMRNKHAAVSIIGIGAQDTLTVFANRKSDLKKTDQQEIAELLLKAKEPEKRTFDAMLDEFSAHHLVIRPVTGVLSTPEFISFQRTNEKNWGPIVTILQKVTKLLSDYGFHLAYVDGKKIAALAQDELSIPSLTVEHLMACLVDLRGGDPQRLKDKKIKINYNQGKFGKQLAAIVIQKTWRMHSAMIRYKELIYHHHCAKVIQQAWFLRRKFFSTRREINRLLEDDEKSWRLKMDRFCSNWATIKTRRRYIIHVASLSYDISQRQTIPRFKYLQNSQLFRLLDLVDENVQVLYVSAFPVSDDAIQYVTKILAIAGVTNPEKRFKFIYPESFDKYPEYTSLTNSLLWSERTIKNIKTLMMGKEEVYLVPGIQNKEDFRLALKLQVPVLGADPAKSIIYRTKSGCRRIFAAADVNTAPGVYDIQNERELLLQLSKKIIEHPEYHQWLIKIDNEFQGRGTVLLDLSRVKCLSEEGRREIMNELTMQNNVEGFLDVLRDRLYFELREFMSYRVRIVSSFVYPTWEEFVLSFKRNGGVIEAVPQNIVGSPVVNMMVEPDGNVIILSVQEQLLSPPFCTLGAAFPQSSVPYEALRDATLSIGRVCAQKHLFGYISVQYVAFIGEGNALKLWGNDININLTNSSLFHQVFDAVTGGKMDPITGQYVSCKSNAPLKKSYVYSGLMRHPELQTWRHSAFFALCRQKGISFDVSTRTGSLFHLVDTLNKGCLGIICVGKTPAEAIVSFSDVIDFITNELNDDFVQPVDEESNMHAIVECSKELISKCIRNSTLKNS